MLSIANTSHAALRKVSCGESRTVLCKYSKRHRASSSEPSDDISDMLKNSNMPMPDRKRLESVRKINSDRSKNFNTLVQTLRNTMDEEMRLRKELFDEVANIVRDDVKSCTSEGKKRYSKLSSVEEDSDDVPQEDDLMDSDSDETHFINSKK